MRTSRALLSALSLSALLVSWADAAPLMRIFTYQPASPANGAFGTRCCFGGLPADPWVAFSDPNATFNGPGSGRVWIYRAHDSSGLPVVLDGSPGDHWGASLSLACVDNNTDPDLLIGAPGSPEVDPDSPGKVVVVFEGSSPGSHPQLELLGTEPGGEFGAAVAGLYSARQGGAREAFAVGAPRVDGMTGAVYLLRIDSLMHVVPVGTLQGEAAGDRFGASLANAGRTHPGADRDWNVADLLVGAPGSSAVAAEAGRAYLFRSTDGYAAPAGPPIATWSGEAAGDHFGAAVAGAGDFGEFGRSYSLVGAPDAEVLGAGGAGRAYVFETGGTPSPVPSLTLAGETAQRHLGSAVEIVSDPGGGNVGAALVGGPGEPGAGLSGEVRFHDFSRDTLADATIVGDAANDGFGASLSFGWSYLQCDACGYPRYLEGAIGAPGRGATGQGYLYRIDAPRLPVSQGEPAAVRLLVPLPNPTHGSLRLGFALVRPGRARLAIVDVSGRNEAVLADGSFGAGEHVFTWSVSGARRAPGIRWVVLTTDGGREARRVVVLN